MKKILAVLFIFTFPSICWGKVGDVYYCETFKNLDISKNETRKKSIEKFKFKRNAEDIRFIEGWKLATWRLKINFSEAENFYGRDTHSSHFSYDNGLFVFSTTYLNSVTVIFASCDVNN